MTTRKVLRRLGIVGVFFAALLVVVGVAQAVTGGPFHVGGSSPVAGQTVARLNLSSFKEVSLETAVAKATVGRQAACDIVNARQKARLSGVPVSMLGADFAHSIDKGAGATCTWVGGNVFVGSSEVVVGRLAVSTFRSDRLNFATHPLANSAPDARWFAKSGFNGIVVVKAPSGWSVYILIQGTKIGEVKVVLKTVASKIKRGALTLAA
jgi:hypothetical protein